MEAAASGLGENDLLMWRAVLAAAAAVLIWVIKQFYSEVQKWRLEKRKQRNLVRALFAEIDFNTRDMEDFLKNSVSVDRIRRTLTQFPDLVPHVTDARHTEIYRNRIGDLHDISDQLLKKTVYFYGLLEKIRVQVEGVSSPGYVTLTLDGRIAVIELIRKTSVDARDAGKDILFEFQRVHKKLGLRRHVRGRYK